MSPTHLRRRSHRDPSHSSKPWRWRPYANSLVVSQLANESPTLSALKSSILITMTAPLLSYS